MTLEACSIRVGLSDATQHLWLHKGMRPASPTPDGGEPYADSAYIPNDDKRRLTDEEWAALRTEWHWPPSASVLSFKLDAAIMSTLRQLESNPSRNVCPRALRQTGSRLWGMICDVSPLSSLGPVQWLGVSSRPSGLTTSTLDGDIGRRIGLHIDSWDRLPLSLRDMARVRLCVNLGLGNRSFLFLPYDVVTIHRAVTQQTGILYADPRRLVSDYCSMFPETPVLELEIPPGYAYLAPTENLLHDGRSSASPQPDITVAWLGYLMFTGALMP